MQQARELAANDGLTAARDVVVEAAAHGVQSADLAALSGELDRLLAHTETAEAFRDFYATDTPERTWLPEPLLARAHEIHPRLGMVRQRLQAQGATTVLELGCFDGWVLLNLATAGFRGVGIDLNPSAIAEATRRAQVHGLPAAFLTGFLEETETAERFDAVLLLEVLEHVLDVDRALAAAERCLAARGRVYISAPLTPPAHQHERERREHLRLLDAPTLKALCNAPGRRLVSYDEWPAPDQTMWQHLAVYERI